MVHYQQERLLKASNMKAKKKSSVKKLKLKKHKSKSVVTAKAYVAMKARLKKGKNK